MARFLTRLIDAQGFWARPLGDFNRRWLGAIYDHMGPLKKRLTHRKMVKRAEEQAAT